MNSNISVGFTLKDVSSNIWARLEQEYNKKVLDQTSLADVYGMLSYASTGRSALGYAKRACTYVTIVDKHKIIIDLDFFVWPSNLDLQYSLSADIGEISEATVLNLDRSFDIIFNGSDSEIIPYVFEGDLVPQMPFITPDGERIDDIEPEVVGSVVSFDQKVFCVLRANGIVKGHKYTITMTLDKAPEGEEGEEVEEYKIENLNNTIVVSWTDEVGETKTDSITLDIPDCVTALLEKCGDGTLAGSKTCVNESCGGEPMFVVYYNTCDGKPVLKRWEENV